MKIGRFGDIKWIRLILTWIQILYRQYLVLSTFRKRILKFTAFLVFFWFFLGITDILFPLPPTKEYSQVIYDKEGNLLCAYLTADHKWRLETHTKDINPDMVKAILYKEDAWFYFHYGVNPVSLMRAFFNNIISGERTSGASTITMQLVRLVEPRSRTYLSKVIEIFRAIQYEWHYSKQEILEMYLSYLPYGGNIEGVHSASYLYYLRPPLKLSLSQCIMLAVVPNHPNALRPDRKVDKTIHFRNVWIQKMKKDKIFPEKALVAATTEPVSAMRFQIKPETPHLCQYLHTKEGDTALYTTIDIKTQKITEGLLAEHIKRVSEFGVTNGAVLIVDNHTHEVITYCGSADFNNNQAKGQVNGITSYRSPGSALKPVIYAMGFDRGTITPKMKLPDIPANFSGYTPDNFDLRFRGLVTVHEALAHSLNLPPIWLLDQIGFESFANMLEKAGFSDVKKRRNTLGYSLALGGCGVTLEEITRFYTCFANEGKMYPLVYLKSKPKSSQNGVTLFSPASVYLIGNILSDLERPDLPQNYINDSKAPKIAWKTGTSYGKRDAWAIGYSPRYTIGIWTGNMDGSGVPELTGAEIAMPLLLDIFNAIDFNPQKKWFDRPESIQERMVCAETGMLPSPETCPQKVSDFYIRNISSLMPCNLYQELTISPDERYLYCPVCCPSEGFIRKKYPVYEPAISLWMRTELIGIKMPPPHFSLCPAKISGEGPKIISPAANHEYYIEKGRNQQIALHAAAGASVTNLHWYVNGIFIKTTPKDEKVFITPEPGGNVITCIDDKGRKTEVKTRVRIY